MMSGPHESFKRLYQGESQSAHILCEVRSSSPCPFLIQDRRVGFPSWMSRVRIPSPAFLGKLLGFNIIQRESFLAETVAGSGFLLRLWLSVTEPANIICSLLSLGQGKHLRKECQAFPKRRRSPDLFFNPGFFERSLL